MQQSVSPTSKKAGPPEEDPFSGFDVVSFDPTEPTVTTIPVDDNPARFPHLTADEVKMMSSEYFSAVRDRFITTPEVLTEVLVEQCGIFASAEIVADLFHAEVGSDRNAGPQWRTPLRRASIIPTDSDAIRPLQALDADGFLRICDELKSLKEADAQIHPDVHAVDDLVGVLESLLPPPRLNPKQQKAMLLYRRLTRVEGHRFEALKLQNVHLFKQPIKELMMQIFNFHYGYPTEPGKEAVENAATLMMSMPPEARNMECDLISAFYDRALANVKEETDTEASQSAILSEATPTKKPSVHSVGMVLNDFGLIPYSGSAPDAASYVELDRDELARITETLNPDEGPFTTTSSKAQIDESAAEESQVMSDDDEEPTNIHVQRIVSLIHRAALTQQAIEQAVVSTETVMSSDDAPEGAEEQQEVEDESVETAEAANSSPTQSRSKVQKMRQAVNATRLFGSIHRDDSLSSFKTRGMGSSVSSGATLSEVSIVDPLIKRLQEIRGVMNQQFASEHRKAMKKAKREGRRLTITAQEMAEAQFNETFGESDMPYHQYLYLPQLKERPDDTPIHVRKSFAPQPRREKTIGVARKKKGTNPKPALLHSFVRCQSPEELVDYFATPSWAARLYDDSKTRAESALELRRSAAALNGSSILSEHSKISVPRTPSKKAHERGIPELPRKVEPTRFNKSLSRRLTDPKTLPKPMATNAPAARDGDMVDLSTVALRKLEHMGKRRLHEHHGSRQGTFRDSTIDSGLLRKAQNAIAGARRVRL